MKQLLAFACAVSFLGSGVVAAQQVHPSSGSVVETVAKLRAGEFVWEPHIAPKGSTLLIVNVKAQRAVLFRNGIPIGASTVSTGKKGYETPTGVFTILQKHVEHYSSKYDNAPMPYMQRLTWRGVALHAGNLPGYPASHGCIRLPLGFAKLLYGATSMGMTVIVTSKAVTPRIAPTPDLAVSGSALVNSGSGGFDWHPGKSPAGPVSVIISASDKRAVVLRNGVEIGSAPVEVAGPASGTWAYALRAVDDKGQHWVRLDLSAGDAVTPVQRSEWQKFAASRAFKDAVASILEPGTTVVVTPDSLQAGATGAAVNILENEDEPSR